VNWMEIDWKDALLLFFFYSGKYQAHTFKQKTSQKHYIK
jgi:hypothetical protein